MLQSMGLQRVRHDWVTQLNWTELNVGPRDFWLLSFSFQLLHNPAQVSSLPGSRKESTLLGYLPLTWYFPCIISISRISVKRYSLSQEAICRLVFAWNLEYLLGTNLDMLLMPVTWTRLTDLRAMGGEAVTEVRREIDSNNPDWATGPQGCWGKLDWVNR